MSDQLALPPDNTHISRAVEKLNSVSGCFSGFDTHYKRTKWLVDNGYMIEPEEIVLGNRSEVHYSAQLKRSTTVVVEDTFQYIPLDKLLAKILEDPNSVSLISRHRLHGLAEYPRMRDFVDTRTYRMNGYLKRHPEALLLHFFVDAFETVNVLGSRTSIHKLEGLYCVIRNVPNKYLSKTKSIFLVGLWYALDVKRYGYDKLLEPLSNICSCLNLNKVSLFKFAVRSRRCMA